MYEEQKICAIPQPSSSSSDSSFLSNEFSFVYRYWICCCLWVFPPFFVRLDLLFNNNKTLTAKAFCICNIL